MMWASLEKLMKLPPETVIYSSHEYTAATLVLQLRLTRTTRHWPNVQAVVALRADNQPTVPSLLSEELATNPFLRAGDPTIRQHLDMSDADDKAVFGEIRAGRIIFRRAGSIRSGL